MKDIEIKVVSNRDNLRSKRWPSYLCCRPMIGDYILDIGGFWSAKIIRITHVYRQNDLNEGCQPTLELYVDEE